jgi:hypothetical protein
MGSNNLKTAAGFGLGIWNFEFVDWEWVARKM